MADPDNNFTNLTGSDMAEYLTEGTQKLSSFICGVVMLNLCAFGLVGNLVSTIIFSHESMRSSINVLLCGLSLIDLALVVLAIPTFCLPGLNTYLKSDLLNRFIPFVYPFIYPFACIAQTCSVWIFILITVERFIAVRSPLKAREWCTTKRARKSLLVTVALAVAYNLVRFWEYQVVWDPENRVNVEAFLSVNQTYRDVYGFYLFLLTHYFLPFVLLTVMNSWTASTIRKAKRARETITRQHMNVYRVTWMLIVIIAIFSFCETPLFLLNLAESVNPRLFEQRSTKFIAYMVLDICNSLIVLNSSTTSIIYYICSQKYRKICRRLVRLTSANSLASARPYHNGELSNGAAQSSLLTDIKCNRHSESPDTRAFELSLTQV